MTTTQGTPAISEETRRRIEEALRNWSDGHSEARQRFEPAQENLDRALQPLEDAIIASEHLTEDDFAVRINSDDLTECLQ